MAMVMENKVRRNMIASTNLQTLGTLKAPICQWFSIIKTLRQDIKLMHLWQSTRLLFSSAIFLCFSQHWLQLLGTSMGSRVSPTWANLFFGVLEKKIIQNCPQHLKDFIFLWKRFIDDVLLIFTGSWQQFEEFFEYLNSTHSTIKYDKPCYNPEENSCNFLDLKISTR